VSLDRARRRRALGWSAAAAVAVAALGAAMTDLSPWYYSLAQPSWNPPDWLFGPAWTLIYALTAWSAALAWFAEARPVLRRRLLMAYAFNGMLNVLWSYLFFKMQKPDWAAVELIVLWLSIVGLIALAWPRSKLAALLLVPYLAWVSFAGLLNRAVVLLNAPFS
jgi:tryptophan-rich sensory protein